MMRRRCDGGESLSQTCRSAPDARETHFHEHNPTVRGHYGGTQ